MLIIACKFNLW